MTIRITILAAMVLTAPCTAQGRLDGDALRAAAAEVDARVEQGLAQHGQRPNEIVDDATFLRRAHLGIVGRIPTLAETERFLDSRARNRRAQLIDELQASPGRTSHELDQWADLLRAKSRLAPQTSGAPYLQWLKEAIAANRPYDEFVRELLTAEGAAHAPGNGATGYYLRDRGMPEDNMANTVRVFLGTRLECAQCHDHPFDEWTQKQFFEMAAFTGGIGYRQDLRDSENGRRIQAMARRVGEELGRDGQRALRFMLRGVASGVSGSGTGLAKLPDDYRYDDAEPGQFVVARPMFGEPVELDVQPPRQDRGRAGDRRRRVRPRRVQIPEIGSRAAFAEWLTSPANPRFTTVIANRMWKRVMGRGLIEPADDLKADTVASNPEVLAYLEGLMIELGYDLREFQRVLFHTATFQRATPAGDPSDDAPYLFPGPLLRRMSAEQLWDSLLVLAVHDVDATIGALGDSDRITERYEELVSMNEEQLRQRIELVMLREADPAAYRRQLRELRTAREAEERSTRDATVRRARPLLRELAAARRDGDLDREERIFAELEEQGLLDALRGMNRELVRASELPSPAPDGHFLREFGQSDREQIEAASTTATVPQVLALLNGFVEKRILRRREAPLMLALERAETPADAVRTAFLAIYNREPTRDELATWRGDVRKLGDQGCQDLVWTLVNSHEFRFVR